jgi:cysteine desulfuration protein SufE
MTIKEAEDEIVSEFALFSDWMEKYEYIIELGKEMPIVDPKHQTESNLIPGCQSRVWLHAEHINGKIVFTANSDAIITKGIISLLIRVLSNQRAEDILNAELLFIQEIGLTDHLSPTRSNGLVSMVKQMKNFAFAFSNAQ